MAFSPFKFLQEVRSETAKVTWPTRREVTITTIMVFVMVALASIFFFVADLIIRYTVTFGAFLIRWKASSVSFILTST